MQRAGNVRAAGGGGSAHADCAQALPHAASLSTRPLTRSLRPLRRLAARDGPLRGDLRRKHRKGAEAVAHRGDPLQGEAGGCLFRAVGGAGEEPAEGTVPRAADVVGGGAGRRRLPMVGQFFVVERHSSVGIDTEILLSSGAGGAARWSRAFGQLASRQSRGAGSSLLRCQQHANRTLLCSTRKENVAGRVWPAQTNTDVTPNEQVELSNGSNCTIIFRRPVDRRTDLQDGRCSARHYGAPLARRIQRLQR